MWIQSTVEITREEAIDKAIKRFAEKHRKKFELMFDSELEEYIDGVFSNYRIIPNP